jgi:HEAT repeat protein
VLLLLAVGLWLPTILGLLVWWVLPRWAPALVIAHAPFPSLVFRAATDGNGSTQTAEARLIAMGRSATGEMITQLHHSDDLARSLALKVLGGIKDPRATDAVIAVLNDPRESLHSVAIDVLRDIGDPNAIPHLLPILSSRTLSLQAAVALKALPDTAVADALRPVLAARTATWGLWTLNDNLDPRVPGWLDAEMRSDAPEANAENTPQTWQESAASALATNPQPACRRLLVNAMTDGSAQVRRRAALALAFGLQQELSESEQAIVLGLLTDADPGVIEAAAWVCNSHELTTAIPALLQLLDSPVPQNRLAATYGFGITLLEAPATAKIITLLADADENVRIGAANALGRIAGKKPRFDSTLIPPLISALADGSARVRKCAVASLGACADPAVTEALVGKALDDADPGIVLAALDVLRNTNPELTAAQQTKVYAAKNRITSGKPKTVAP